MSLLTSSPLKARVELILPVDDVRELKLLVFNLRHQVTSLKSENSLLHNNNESLSSKYEEIITEKNNKIQSLEDNFQYVYKEREALKTLTSNSTQINDSKNKQLQHQLDKVNEENDTLKAQLDEVDDSIYKLNLKYQKAKSDLDYYRDINDQLEDRLSSLEEDNNQILKHNDELINKLEKALKKSISSNSLQINESLHSKNVSLQRTNNQLQLKVDKLLQNKTSIELLKQKNAGLSNQVTELQQYKEKFAQLEIEKLKLNTTLSEFDKLFKDTAKGNALFSPSKFIDDYTYTRNMNLILEDKLNKAMLELNEYKTNFVEMEHQINDELQPIIGSLQNDLISKNQIIESLQHQLKLSSQQIEFLRELLNKLEKINFETQKEAVQKSTDEYLSNLEKLVDDYKQEISSLQRQLREKTEDVTDYTIGNKRQKVDDAYRRQSEIENTNIHNENTKLQATVKNLSSQVEFLESKLKKEKEIQDKEKQFRVLQLKSNPFTQDQLIKKEAIDSLRKENEELIAKLALKFPEDLQVPKAVFERQEVDKAQLQAKVDDLLKRNIRLKEGFTKKARDILSTISQFFGFSIEFLETSVNLNEVGSKIKLISKYAFSDNSYIILDISAKSLKAYGNHEFKEFCSELVQEWSNDKDQMSCILSALNIKLYQRSRLRLCHLQPGGIPEQTKTIQHQYH